MKRSISIVLSILLVLSLAACNTPGSSENSPETTAATTIPQEQETVSYTPIADNLEGKTLNEFALDVALDTQAHKLAVEQSLAYYNDTEVALSEIYFNLIPNAYHEEGGSVKMHSITAGGSEAALTQVKGTVYTLPLANQLHPGETVHIKMEYDVHIPNIADRFGYNDNVYNLGNFIVTPAVYEADGWSVQPYVDIGDAFYTDIANYIVKITAPEGYTIAATGKQGADGAYYANKVRDFVFCAGNDYNTLTETVHNTEIIVYYEGNNARTAARIMETSKRSLALFNELLGEYPYEALSIVHGDERRGNNSGMEYPTLVMVTSSTIEKIEENLSAWAAEEHGAPSDTEAETMIIERTPEEVIGKAMLSMERTVVHEIAHQWMYGIVGNDQIRYPWLDEGMCRFLETAYEIEYPPAIFDDIDREALWRDEYGAVHGETDSGKLNWNLYEWMENDPMGYGFVYERGAGMLFHMREQMGTEAFAQSLRKYVDTFAYSFVTPESFRQFWNEQADFSELFDLYFS